MHTQTPFHTPLPRQIMSLVIITGLALTLTGCFERHRTTKKLCENNPEICANLNVKDGQCRIQRTDLIWQRYDAQNASSDLALFKTLQLTDKYIFCLEYAARIEPTELKERKSQRMLALYDSYEKKAALEAKLAHSNDPRILYHRWSQGDEYAQSQFLALEGKPALNTPDLQLALAGYYSRYDKDKSYQLLHHALTLYRANETVNPEIIKSLATLAQQQKKYQEAYIWVLIANDIKITETDEKKVARRFLLTEDEQNSLAKKAKNILTKIKKGNYQQVLIN